MPVPPFQSYLDVTVDEDILDMIEDFLANQRKEVRKLEAVTAAADYKAAWKIGHTLKGVGGSYGFHWLTEMGLEIQRAANEEPAALPALVEQLTTYLQTVRYRAG